MFSMVQGDRCGRVSMALRFGIVDEVLALGVPAQFSAQHHGDVADVGYGDRAVADLGGGVGRLAGLHAVVEVTMLTPLAAVTGGLDFVGVIDLDLGRVNLGLKDRRVAGLKAPRQPGEASQPLEPWKRM